MVKLLETVSSISLAGDKGRYWSQAFESTKLLMVELTRCWGTLNARTLSSVAYIRLRSVTNKKINDMLHPDCQHDSDSVRVDLNSWVLRTPLSLFEAIDSVTGSPEMGACHCIRFPS